jgi:hypothetical protein
MTSMPQFDSAGTTAGVMATRLSRSAVSPVTPTVTIDALLSGGFPHLLHHLYCGKATCKPRIHVG